MDKGKAGPRPHMGLYVCSQTSNEVARDMLNLSTLAERRLSICSTLFRQITRESHVLHYLLPAKRDAEVIGRLQSTKKYPTVRARYILIQKLSYSYICAF